MDRGTARRLIAIALAVFAVYRLLALLPLLDAGPVGAWSFAGRLVQAVVAAIAAVGVWRGAGWSPGAVIALGAAIAVTALGDALLVGILAPLEALVRAVVALLATLLLAQLLRRPPLA